MLVLILTDGKSPCVYVLIGRDKNATVSMMFTGIQARFIVQWVPGQARWRKRWKFGRGTNFDFLSSACTTFKYGEVEHEKKKIYEK